MRRTSVNLLAGALLCGVGRDAGPSMQPSGPVTRLLLEPDSRKAACPYPVLTGIRRNLYA